MNSSTYRYLIAMFVLGVLIQGCTYLKPDPAGIEYTRNNPEATARKSPVTVFEIKFNDLIVSPYRWESPSSLTINDQGEYTLSAKRLINTPNGDPKGKVREVGVTVSYYGATNCNGPILLTSDYSFGLIGYGNNQKDISVSGTDNRFPDVALRAMCAKTRQWIR